MCFGGGSGSSEPKAPVQPVENNQQIQQVADDRRRQQRAALGISNSRLTGALGDTSQAQTINKTLLG